MILPITAVLRQRGTWILNRAGVLPWMSQAGVAREVPGSFSLRKGRRNQSWENIGKLGGRIKKEPRTDEKCGVLPSESTTESLCAYSLKRAVSLYATGMPGVETGRRRENTRFPRHS